LRLTYTLYTSGADFIKTSTGKEGVNAVFPVALVMVRAIREYYQRTGYKVFYKSTKLTYFNFFLIFLNFCYSRKTFINLLIHSIKEEFKEI
jgi:hypothetical protein